jgi:aminotransferase
MGLECFKPFGSFYVFPSIARTGLSSQQFSVGLLKEKSVAVVPGTAFGASGEGFVRACYATSLEQLKVAVGRIREFVRETEAARAAA